MTDFRSISLTNRSIIRTGGERLRPKADERDRDAFLPPPRPHYNYVPPAGVIQTLVERALEALSRGIYWDRGSIVNLLL